MAPQLVRRQCSQQDYDDGNCLGGYGNYDGDDGSSNWWWSSTGLAVRYAIVVVIFLVVVVFLLFGYFHAQRRMRKGLAPLPYHRWLVRRQYARHATPQVDPHRQNTYSMQNYAPPPPAYNHWDAPPQYQPPEGGSKVMADQNVRSVGVDGGHAGESSNTASVVYSAPSHPPPGHITQ